MNIEALGNSIIGCHLGYLFNWHVPVMKDGIKRMVHHL